jgi:hypothetical protein
MALRVPVTVLNEFFKRLEMVELLCVTPDLLITLANVSLFLTMGPSLNALRMAFFCESVAPAWSRILVK